MTRRQWMWLWLWLLLFFMIFCVWNKLQTLKSDYLSDSSTETISNPIAAVVPQTEKSSVETEPTKLVESVEEIKDINLKIVKEDNIVKISGLFSSKEELEKLKEAYAKNFDKVEEDYIVFDKNANNEKLIANVSALSGDFSKFKNGYIEYADKKLIVDGNIADESIKKSIADKLSNLENIDFDNSIKIDTPKVEVKPAVAEKAQEKEDKPSNAMVQKELNDLLKIKKVEFKFSSSELTSKGKKTIDEVFNVLTKYIDINVDVEGHTDSIGSKEKNRVLSQKRADSIKSYLVSKGIKADRLNPIGYGESKPLVKNNSKTNRQINRRVEFKVKGE